MKHIFIILLAAMATLNSAQALTLEDFTLNNRPYGIGATQPAADGVSYYRMKNHSQIVMTDYETGKRDKVVFDSKNIKDSNITQWDGYKFSQKENKILLWTNSNAIYRYSICADYYVYDTASGTMTALSEDGGEEIPTFAPDGNRIAFVKDNNVFVRDLADGTVQQVTSDGKRNSIINAVPDWVYQEEFGILNSFTWSADGNTLAFIRFDESEVPMYSMTLYEGACNANPDYALYPGSYDYKYPVAGEKNSVVTAHAYRVDNKHLSKLNVPITDNDYIPHIAFAPVGSKLMVSTLNRTQNDFNIYCIDTNADSVTKVYSEQSETWIDSELANSVTYYDTFFVIPSERSGYTQLYQYSLDGKLIKQLTYGSENVTHYYGYDKGKQRFFYQSTNGAINRKLCMVDKKGKVIDLTQGTGTYAATFSSNFNYYMRNFSDVDTPNQYSIFNTQGKRVRDVQINEEYAAKFVNDEVPRRRFFTFNSDGYELNGYMIKPIDFDPLKKYPVIMVQYSGPGSQQVLNRWSMEWQEYFAMQGFIIACVDGRGTGGRGKAFESVVYQNLGHYESIDQIAAAQYMASLPYVDGDHIGIWGWSYGGYEVLMSMSTEGSNYACGVSIAPVTSWKFYDTIYAERYMRTPQENPEGYKNGAPLEHVDRLKGKVLIMFGSADDNVHIINAMQYIAKLHEADKPFDMMVYPNMNHSINGCGIRLPLYRRVLDFYTMNLKP